MAMSNDSDVITAHQVAASTVEVCRN